MSRRCTFDRFSFLLKRNVIKYLMITLVEQLILLSGRSVKRRYSPLKWIVEINCWNCWNVTLLNLRGCEFTWFRVPFCFLPIYMHVAKLYVVIHCETFSVANIFSVELHEKANFNFGCACHEKTLNFRIVQKKTNLTKTKTSTGRIYKRFMLNWTILYFHITLLIM